jgi:hypothetical protein
VEKLREFAETHRMRDKVVVGWDDEQAVQIEGFDDEPKGAELGETKLQRKVR